ncbi:MAG TPA: ferrochelatase [Candidatus Acidoferrales bacterium]|nr:ferrochelatase [Candidatus Acidoferrales bacterium]
MGSVYDAVLVLAFGGPQRPEEIRPFLGRVLEGARVPAARLEEVARHYEALGGRSPLNELTGRQAAALENSLGQKGYRLPVYVGMRFSAPFIRDALARMAADGVTSALAVILSSHQSEASWERYQRAVAGAQSELEGRAPRVEYCPGWHAEPLFISAWKELIEAEFQKLSPARRATARLVFTAHSIPLAMAERSPYVEQIRETAALIARRLGHARWTVAYQSRSGDPRQAWLEPDILSVLSEQARAGATEVVVAPIGFVSDHVEVLYDLDVEARKAATDLGICFYRARCPNDHPLFIRMLAELVVNRIEGGR